MCVCVCIANIGVHVRHDITPIMTLRADIILRLFLPPKTFLLSRKALVPEVRVAQNTVSDRLYEPSHTHTHTHTHISNIKYCLSILLRVICVCVYAYVRVCVCVCVCVSAHCFRSSPRTTIIHTHMCIETHIFHKYAYAYSLFWEDHS
jgi:hypothetical protein